jgi:hypothetical protein
MCNQIDPCVLDPCEWYLVFVHSVLELQGGGGRVIADKRLTYEGRHVSSRGIIVWGERRQHTTHTYNDTHRHTHTLTDALSHTHTHLQTTPPL